MEKIKNYINGKKINSFLKRTKPLFNPTTGKQTGEVVLSSVKDLKNAVVAAQAAFPNWAARTPLSRARIISKFCNLVMNNIDDIAKCLSNSHGKVFSDAKGEIIRGVEVAEFATGIAHLLKGEFSLNVGTNVDSYSMLQPLGIVSGITPFNFPVMVPLWMHAIAIPCGNCFILKPSEKNPQVSLIIAELYKEAGLPDGVFQIVNGDKEIVDVILQEEYIEAVSFVGSTPIAKYIYQSATTNKKKVQALGGAKNHMVVMPDADIDIVSKSLIGSAYGSAGERCMAISVVVTVGVKTADKLIQELKINLKNLVVGASLAQSPESQMGPLISKEHLEKVKEYVNLGVTEGANLVVDGRNFTLQGYEQGFFMGPCLFDNVTKQMRIYQEEIFGPVLCVVRVKTYQEALELVNSHKFGNGAAIFTKDGETARKFTKDIQVGMVGINIPIPVPSAFYSFGGWKDSIFGSLNIHGKDGIRFYTKLKTITSRWPKTLLENQFTIPTM